MDLESNDERREGSPDGLGLSVREVRPPVGGGEAAEGMCPLQEPILEHAPGRCPSGKAAENDWQVTHWTWWGVIHRCTNPNHPGWKYYGGRGIQVCARWADQGVFMADVGPRPCPHVSLDRINADGHYEPGNCRWATRSVQATNKSKGGVVVPLAEAVAVGRGRGTTKAVYKPSSNREDW